MATSFNVNVNDLQYILRQIKIAEATSAAYTSAPKTITQAIMDSYGVTAANAAQLPAGLRTVDGTFNNLTAPGAEYGAADNLFPRLTDPNFQTVNGPGIDFNGDGIMDVINQNYGDASAAPGTQIRSVVDVDPRVISNLIVDMSPSNPAAIDSFVNNPLSMEYFAAYLVEHSLPPVAEADVAAWLANAANGVAASDIMKTIPNQSPDIGLSPGFNSWMTFFGQFFDHGLDLVTKGKNGTVYVPLQADDPLYDKGADGIANNIVDAYFVSDPSLSPPGQQPAVSGVATAWQAFYVVDPTGWPPGAPPPAMSTTGTFGAVKINDDGAGADGIFSTADDRPNFMALTRATVTLDANGVPQHENTTTSWIDQNQTYTSHASHQVFLREYTMRDIDGVGGNGPVAVSTGRLIDGTTASGSLNGAIGNWGEVKAQATAMLGLTMNDFNVHDAPLLKTDQYGKFIAGANGFAQVAVNVTIVDTTTGATVTTLAPTFIEGVSGGLDINALTSTNLPAGYTLPPLGANQAYKVVTIGTGHAFLNDIAHHAAPAVVDHDHNPGTAKIQQITDFDMLDANGDGVSDAADVTALGTLLTDANGDTVIDALDLADVNLDGTINAKDAVADDHNSLTYDNEMLDAHFVTGDGRGNENIALTSVHSIFHSEHNRLVEVNKTTLLANAAAGGAAELAFLNEWLAVDVTAVPTDQAGLDALVWDGERLFQAARFSTEMQYQHLVFEEFARRVQPMVDPFIFNSAPELDPSIVAEFAHTVYRFGHSMLTGTVDRLDNNLDPVNGDADQASLLAAFLNPQMFVASGSTVEEANANLIRALSRDVGNAIDEFIVPDVRSTLLGLPLDLAALNIARGRETGVPSLNETRKQLYEGSDPQPADLKPYESWADFGANLKNPASLVNFVAAYGTHASILAATDLAGMRAAAATLMQGAINVTLLGSTDPADLDAYDFLYGLGAYAGGSLGGLNTVDLWIGGLAEAHPEFGGMLGTTFNFIFELQMENLQFGDRMYYLTRTQGLNILNNLEPNTFSDLVMRNTDLGDQYATHLNGALFVTPDHILELDRGIAQEDYNGAAAGLDPLWGVGEVHSALTPTKVIRSYAGATTVVDDNGTPLNPLDDVTHDVGGMLRFTGGEHVVVGGTEGRDRIFTDRGIDTLWGDGGNDYLNAGTESDDVFGGEGDDIIEDPFGDDVLRGNQGNDVISEARGADLVFGDEGKDYLILGQDAAEVFGGEGDDFILGGAGKDFLLGNEGNDWIEGGAGFDTIAGDNSELFFNSTIIGHDVLFHGSDEGDYDAELGDDIMGSGPSVFRYEGMFGFDWAIAKNDITGVDFDMAIPIFTTIANDVLKDRFDQTEAFSGWKYNDVLRGDDRGHKGGGSSAPNSVPTELFADHLLTQDGINRIDGLNAWFGGFDGTDARQTLFGGLSPVPGSTPVSTWRDGNILMGGDGNDTIQGRGGYDLIDGDAYLNVRIRIDVGGTIYSAESMSTDTVLSGQYAGKVYPTDANGNPIFTTPAFGGATLNSLMLNGTINPGNMTIVRELKDGTVGATETDSDTVILQGSRAEYDIEGIINTTVAGASTITYSGTANDADGDGFISVRDRDTGAVGATVWQIVDGEAVQTTLTSRGLLTDDRDLLKNIEQLQFADQLITIGGNNSAASGTVTINDMTPIVGQILTATLSNVVDANGLPAGFPAGVLFEWQTTEFGSNSGWSTIETNNGNYTVRAVDPGHVLRAVAVFPDALGNIERIYSAGTDNPTAPFSVNENSVNGTVVGLQIPFSVDYDSQSINGAPPVDVDLTTLFHQIDSNPANNAGGRFTVVENGVDFNGFPRFSLVVDQGGPQMLNYEAPLHTPANQSYQNPDNQYQVVINSYSDDPNNGGVLVAVRQFTVMLNDVTGEPVDLAPTLDLTGDQTIVTNTNGQYRDEFTNAALNNSNGTTAWAAAPWVETGDNADTNSATLGQITIDSGNNNVLRFGDNDADTGNGTATIQRAVNLAGVTTATLSYSFNEQSFDAGEIVTVTFAADGVNFNQTIQVINGNSGNGNTSVALTGPFTANAAVRFVVSGTNNNSATDAVTIDNVNIATVTTTTTIVPGAAGNNYATTYTENGAAVAIASNPAVADSDNTSIMGATVKLTNAQVGDVLAITGALPAGITLSFGPAVAGEITLYLSGPATAAAFQTAIGQVRFGNPADQNPIAGDRTINVTVNDGEKESNIATATVTVVSVDDPTVANGELIVTNAALGTAFVVPEWALLANDSDVDSPLDVTALPASSGVTVSLAANPGSVTITDTAPANGSFSYTSGVNAPPVNATVNVASIAATETVNVRDNFGNGSYANNNGSVNWTGNWNENGDGSGSNGGDIIVTTFNGSGQLNFNAGIGTGDNIARSVNLSGATTATLTLNWSDAGADAGENIVVEAFNGTTWDTLGTLSGGDADGNNKAFTANLTGAQLRADAAIRFRDVGGLNNNENFYIDNVDITFTRPAAVTGGNGTQILVGDANGSTFSGGAGNDIVFAGAGSDTIVQTGSSDGRDFVDGGTTGAGPVDTSSDTYVLNGVNGSETFNIYTAAAAATAGLSGLKADTEIVVTRNGTIIAELDNIEEITVNTFDVTANNGGGLTGGSSGGDTINVFGNFNAPNTSLNFSTITVNGGQGADIIDVSQLELDHRVVLNSGGGNDAIVGAERLQDVLNIDDVIVGTDGKDNLDGGAGADTISGLDDNDTLRGGSGNDRLSGGAGIDVLADGLGNDESFGNDDSDWFIASAGNDAYDGGAGTDVYYAGHLSAAVAVNLATGVGQGAGIGVDSVTAIENVTTGSGDDFVTGDEQSNRLVLGAGDDMVSAGGGNDRIVGGTGDDLMRGGTGSDTFGFQAGFGNDVIADFDANPAGGQDLLDISALGIGSADFADHVEIQVVGADTLVIVDGDSILLKGVGNSGAVTESDFVLFMS